MLRAIIKSRKIYECNICQIRLKKPIFYSRNTWQFTYEN